MSPKPTATTVRARRERDAALAELRELHDLHAEAERQRALEAGRADAAAQTVADLLRERDALDAEAVAIDRCVTALQQLVTEPRLPGYRHSASPDRVARVLLHLADRFGVELIRVPAPEPQDCTGWLNTSTGQIDHGGPCLLHGVR